MSLVLRSLTVLLVVAALVLPSTADARRKRKQRQPPRELPPAYVIERLDDGLTLVVVKVPGPRVSLRYGVRAGGFHDPAELSGGAHLVQRLVLQGGHGVSAAALEDLARRRGATVGGHTSTTWTSYTLDAPKDAFLELLEPYVGMLTNPALEFADLERERQLLAGERRGERAADGAEELLWAIDQLAFPAENRGRTRTGTARSREELHVEELAAFYERHYTPANSVVLIVGDVEVSAVREVLARAVLQPPVPAPERVRDDVEPNAPASAHVRDERVRVASAYALGDVDMRVCDDIAALLELRTLERLVWRDALAVEASVRCERLRGESFVVAHALARDATGSRLSDALHRLVKESARRPPSAAERRALLARHAAVRARERANGDELADALVRRMLSLGGSLEENLGTHFRAPMLDWSQMRPVMERGLRDDRHVLVHAGPS